MADKMAAEAGMESVKKSQKRSLVVILFVFMLLHQTDKYLIGPLSTPIMEAFNINEAQMGLVFTGALLVGGIFYPIWGYLFDRYARPKILALAALLWGATTWLSAITRGFGAFIVTRSSTGIDDASYPGAYSLVSDYFEPAKRGRVISVLQLSAVLAGIIGMGMATAFRDTLGWRGIFYVTGGLGIVVAAVIFFGVKEVPRGQSEPEMQGTKNVVSKKFEWATVRTLIKRPTIVILFIQQFFHVFPFTMINSWFFRYLEIERNLPDDKVMLAAGLFAVMTAISGLIAGALGDWLFRKTPRGRMIVALTGIVGIMICFTLMLNTPVGHFSTFLALEMAAGLFWSFEWPNAVSTVQDITEPEVRSTAHSIIGVAETVGSALAPLLAGVLAVGSSLKHAMQLITLSAWSIGLVLMTVVLIVIPKDVAALRESMRVRVAEGGQEV
ncbi:MAG: MFS transporter [Anaerolineales bacterium]|nr:MFS transporter [Anaerolineales bacterium]